MRELHWHRAWMCNWFSLERSLQLFENCHCLICHGHTLSLSLHNVVAWNDYNFIINLYIYTSIHYSNLLLLNECQHIIRFTYNIQLTVTRRNSVHLERAGVIFRILHCVCAWMNTCVWSNCEIISKYMNSCHLQLHSSMSGSYVPI